MSIASTAMIMPKIKLRVNPRVNPGGGCVGAFATAIYALAANVATALAAAAVAPAAVVTAATAFPAPSISAADATATAGSVPLGAVSALSWCGAVSLGGIHIIIIIVTTVMIISMRALWVNPHRDAADVSPGLGGRGG